VVQELKKKFLTMQKINFSFDLKTILLYGFLKKNFLHSFGPLVLLEVTCGLTSYRFLGQIFWPY